MRIALDNGSKGHKHVLYAVDKSLLITEIIQIRQSDQMIKFISKNYQNISIFSKTTFILLFDHPDL